jgi:hypothetical protein
VDQRDAIGGLEEGTTTKNNGTRRMYSGPIGAISRTGKDRKGVKGNRKRKERTK